MKRFIFFSIYLCVFIAGLSLPGFAEERKIKIDILQVTAVGPYQTAYEGFISELERGGFVQGKNLTIKRTIIDFDIEKAGLWKKVGVLMRIKSEASRIADEKPDLVLTIGTPSTKYARGKIIDAGIPLVFTAVAIPQAVGCRSLTEAGPGFTGATLYMNMNDALKIVRLALSKANTVAIIHSDDDNGISHMEEAKKAGRSNGIDIISREVGKSDKIAPAAQALINEGAEAFIVPLDTYYGLRDNEPIKDLAEISRNRKIPIISFVLHKTPGGVLYVGSDFATIGALSAQQALKILKEGAKPETLPVLKQEELKILVDLKQLTALNYQLPLEILQLAKPIE